MALLTDSSDATVFFIRVQINYFVDSKLTMPPTVERDRCIAL